MGMCGASDFSAQGSTEEQIKRVGKKKGEEEGERKRAKGRNRRERDKNKRGLEGRLGRQVRNLNEEEI